MLFRSATDIEYLSRYLRWDVEEDLGRVLGDVLAHRLVGSMRGLRDWHRAAMGRAVEGLAEYWTEEAPLLATRLEVERFVQDVDTLRDAVERLQQRMELAEAGSLG